VTTGAIKGAEVVFSNSALQLGVSRAVAEREEESAEFKSMFSPRSSPHLIDTDERAFVCPTVCVRVCAYLCVSW